MQLFGLDKDPEKVPRMLCDVHVRKMCLETAQILSGVLFLRSISPAAGMPKAYNCNHPVIQALWDSDFKTAYTLACNEALHREYFFRFRKLHSYASLCPAYRVLLFPEGNRTYVPDWSFARSFKNFTPRSTDLTAAFREYYCYKKSVIRHWQYTARKEPPFLQNCQR